MRGPPVAAGTLRLSGDFAPGPVTGAEHFGAVAGRELFIHTLWNLTQLVHLRFTSARFI
jgi:hypothetical protein